METGEKRGNVCSSLGLAPAAVSTTMTNAEKIKQLAQKTKKLHTSNVSYARNFNIEKMEHLHYGVDYLNQK